MDIKSGIISATALVAGAGVLVAGSTAGSSDAAGSHGRRTLAVVEHAVSDTLIDLGKNGDSRGDQISFQNPVFDARDQHRVGHDLGYCIRTRPGVTFECTWTLVLERGSIVVQGPFRDAGDSTLAITGGTGAFNGARGSMHLHALDTKVAKYRFVYHLAG